jgi:glutathione S-transferase
MDWQATELNNAWRYAFMALVRNSPAHGDPVQLANSVAQWNRHMAILEGRLAKTGGYVAGPDFSLADVVLGLSLNRWLMTPMERPDYPAIRTWSELLRLRPGCQEFCMNGTP